MTTPSKGSYTVVTLAIVATIFAVGFGLATRSDRESTPTPSPSATGARVTYPACSDQSSPPCIEQDGQAWFLVSTGQSDLGPLRTEVTLIERRPPDGAGVEWITVLVPGYTCSGDDVCRGA